MKDMNLFTVAIASLVALGCGGDDETAAPPVESVDAEGCEHMAEGPAVAVTAGAAADDQAPAVGADHKRYDVTLVAGMADNAGYVSFAAAEATDYVFFLNVDVPVAFEDSGGTAIAIEASATSVAECTVVRGRHVVPLAVGTTFFQIGPTSETSVSLVVEEAAGHTE